MIIFLIKIVCFFKLPYFHFVYSSLQMYSRRPNLWVDLLQYSWLSLLVHCCMWVHWRFLIILCLQGLYFYILQLSLLNHHVIKMFSFDQTNIRWHWECKGQNIYIQYFLIILIENFQCWFIQYVRFRWLFRSRKLHRWLISVFKLLEYFLLLVSLFIVLILPTWYSFKSLLEYFLLLVSLFIAPIY